MGCVSSKFVTRTNSFQEEFRERFQGRGNVLPVLEDLLLSKNGGDQFLALVCTANTVARKLHTGVPAIESDVDKNQIPEQANLETINTWELMAGLDEREVEREKEETNDQSTMMLTPSIFNVARGTEGEASRRFGSFHTVEEYDSIVAGNGQSDLDNDNFILQKTCMKEPEYLARDIDVGCSFSMDGNKDVLFGNRVSKMEEIKTEDTKNVDIEVLETSMNNEPLEASRSLCTSMESTPPMAGILEASMNNEPLEASRNCDPLDSRSFSTTELVSIESYLPVPDLPEAFMDNEPLEASRNYDPLDSRRFSITKLTSTESSPPVPGLPEAYTNNEPLEASRNYDPLDSRRFSITKLTSTESSPPVPGLPEAYTNNEPLEASRIYYPLDSRAFSTTKLVSTESSPLVPDLPEAYTNDEPLEASRRSCAVVLQHIGLLMPSITSATCEVNDNLSAASEELANNGKVTEEKGLRSRARTKELDALNIPADGFNFPSIGSLKDWLNCGSGTCVTPKFGNASNSSESFGSNSNDSSELEFFDPEIVAAFEEAMKELTAEEELVLKQIVGRWEEEGM